jgi:hypothetical protein
MTTTDLKASVLAILRGHVGKRQAITGAELARLHGLRDDRSIREAIEELEMHVPIASSTNPPYGYYIVSTKEEAEDYRRVLRCRGEEELRSLDREWRNEQSEFLQNTDRVVKNVGYKYFVSRSKGKNRRRKHWKEVELFRFQAGWHLQHKFHFDDVATELMGEAADGEKLLEHIRQYCPRCHDAGSQAATGIC